MKSLTAFALLLVLFSTSLLAGCGQRNLFAGQDVTKQREKYWDGESVRESREKSKEIRESGFGFPSGPSMQ